MVLKMNKKKRWKESWNLIDDEIYVCPFCFNGYMYPQSLEEHLADTHKEKSDLKNE